MKPGPNVDEWGGSEWVEMTPEEVKREAELGELVKKVLCCTEIQALYRSR